MSGKRKDVILMPVLVAVLLVAGAGCANYRVDHFRTFAEAGRGYGRAIVVLSEEAGHVAIDADSELLLKDRDLFTVDERREIYRQRTEALREILQTLQALRQHALLLDRYFTLLARMADPATPTEIARESAIIIAALRELHPQLSDRALEGRLTEELLDQARPLVVSGFLRRGLARELRANAALIEHELEMQRAVLATLAADLQNDLQVLADAQAYREVARPYVEDGRLPANWQRRRREVLSSYISMAAVDNAVQAAAELQHAFRATVENRMQPEDWPKVFAEINAMLDLVEVAGRLGTGE